MHSYRFFNVERTVVVRDDGATFPWDDRNTPGWNGNELHGFVGEDYRLDGCPPPGPYVPPPPPVDDHDRRRRREAGDTCAGARARR
jgi:hypothetical protein